jgi:hypothetical protein
MQLMIKKKKPYFEILQRNIFLNIRIFLELFVHLIDVLIVRAKIQTEPNQFFLLIMRTHV